jgi:hypothetical protein
MKYSIMIAFLFGAFAFSGCGKKKTETEAGTALSQKEPL